MSIRIINKNKIEWLTDFNEAMALAKQENKPVLLDFFNPG